MLALALTLHPRRPVLFMFYVSLEEVEGVFGREEDGFCVMNEEEEVGGDYLLFCYLFIYLFIIFKACVKNVCSNRRHSYCLFLFNFYLFLF